MKKQIPIGFILADDADIKNPKIKITYFNPTYYDTPVITGVFSAPFKELQNES